MTAPITPDERAAMRERYPRVERPSDPYDEDAWNRYWDDPSPDVLRLLDALDTAEGKTDRQRDHLRAREEQVRRLRAEVTRLHALVTDLRAATSPVWDEDTVTETIARSLRDAGLVEVVAVHEGYGAEEVIHAHLRSVVDAVLAVVREHLPVKPGMEDIYRAWHGTDDPWGGCADRASIERVLAEWPGESRATVQDEALRAAADEAEAMDADALVAGCAAPVSGERGRQSVIDAARVMCEEPWTWLRARADRLKKGGPA